MDLHYLTRRMDEERQRAATAENDAARTAHLELAEYYSARIDQLRRSDTGSGMTAATA